MIASLCDRNAAVRLSQTSRRYRDACCIRLWKVRTHLMTAAQTSNARRRLLASLRAWTKKRFASRATQTVVL